VLKKKEIICYITIVMGVLWLVAMMLALLFVQRDIQRNEIVFRVLFFAFILSLPLSLIYLTLLMLNIVIGVRYFLDMHGIEKLLLYCLAVNFLFIFAIPVLYRFEFSLLFSDLVRLFKLYPWLFFPKI
jgi:hypothetical protein